MSQLSDRSSFNNRLLLGCILAVILAVPAYISIFASVILIYGPKYLLVLAPKPDVVWQYYTHLFNYWTTYSTQLDNSYTLKIIGPQIGAFVLVAIILFLIRAPLMDFRPFKKKESVHGDAAWATPKEVKAMGMLSKEGVLMGQYKKGKYYCAEGFQHILLFAPTGSGKGVGFAIPNLLFWQETCCVHDIKLENYELCSGWRATQGQDVYVWNPADPNGVTHCYNPLDWISEKPGQMVDDVQKVGNLILPEQEFWQNEARSLLVGVILYLCAVPEKVTSFGEVVRTMRSDDVTYNLAVVLDTIGKKIHPVAYMNIAAFLQKADKERSGVVSTLNSGLELWANPLIDTATASSDFNVGHWKRKKMTVYCGVTPDNLQRLQPLLQVFYQQCTDILTRHMPRDDEPYGVLFLLDEFPTLGKMPQFEAGIAYFRGYKCRLFLIVQDTQQLKGIYEEAGMNSFLSNATFRITFAANNVETANLISQMIGNKTVITESHNRPKFLDLNPAARTLHVSEAQRALLLPQEVIQLPRDEQIVLIESQPPIKCKKIFYYKDPFFTKRLLEQTPVPEQEPYDPRKKQGEVKVDDKKDESGAKAADAPPPPPEDKTAAKPIEDKKPAKDEGKKKSANPFDLPPIPEKKAGDDGKKKSANPFDLPPVPDKKSGGDGEKKKTSNPFDLPPVPDKKDADDKGGEKKKAANPFDLPAKKPAKAGEGDAKPKSQAANPFDLPAKPEAKAGAGAEPKKTPAKAANPFELPAKKKADNASDDGGKGKAGKKVNPFELPAKKEAGQEKAASNPFELPPKKSAQEQAKSQPKPAPDPFGAPVKKTTVEAGSPKETVAAGKKPAAGAPKKPATKEGKKVAPDPFGAPVKKAPPKAEVPKGKVVAGKAGAGKPVAKAAKKPAVAKADDAPVKVNPFGLPPAPKPPAVPKPRIKATDPLPPPPALPKGKEALDKPERYGPAIPAPHDAQDTFVGSGAADDLAEHKVESQPVSDDKIVPDEAVVAKPEADDEGDGGEYMPFPPSPSERKKREEDLKSDD